MANPDVTQPLETRDTPNMERVKNVGDAGYSLFSALKEHFGSLTEADLRAISNRVGGSEFIDYAGDFINRLKEIRDRK